MSEGHARFSPSSSDRWLSCTASMLLKSNKKQESSIYAERGTALHEAAHDFLINKPVQKEYFGYEVTPEDMEGTVLQYVAYIRQLEQEENLSVVAYETKVNITDECYGTADFIGYGEGALHVADLKCGLGVKVDAKDNTQLLIYALGAAQAMGHDTFDKVVLHIVQPGIHNFQRVEVTPDDLLELRARIVETISNIAKGKVEYSPSEKACRWCEHKTTCPKLSEIANSVAADEFEMISLSEKMKIIPALKIFIKAVEEETLSNLRQEKEVPGFKLVRTRGKRIFKDEAAFAKAWEAKEYDTSLIYSKPKMLTLPQVEKVIKKQKFDIKLSDFAGEAEGGLRVVAEEVDRPAIDKIQEAINDFN